MGADKDQRFECECGAEIVYTKNCPGEWLHNPGCVCGSQTRAVATQVRHPYPAYPGGVGASTGVAPGQKFMCECGSKVKYAKPSLETVVAPFTCVCGATGTETGDDD